MGPVNFQIFAVYTIEKVNMYLTPPTQPFALQSYSLNKGFLIKCTPRSIIFRSNIHFSTTFGISSLHAQYPAHPSLLYEMLAHIFNSLNAAQFMQPFLL